MNRVIYAIDQLSRMVGHVFAWCIIILMLGTSYEVFVRYVLNHSTIWQTDLITYCITAATFIGSPYVLMTRGHVNVNVLPLYLRPRGRYALALFASLMSAAFCAVMTVMTFLFWKEAWDNRWVSDTMWRARLWIPYSSMPVGLALLTLLLAWLSARPGLGGVEPRRQRDRDRRARRLRRRASDHQPAHGAAGGDRRRVRRSKAALSRCSNDARGAWRWHPPAARRSPASAARPYPPQRRPPCSLSTPLSTITN